MEVADPASMPQPEIPDRHSSWFQNMDWGKPPFCFLTSWVMRKCLTQFLEEKKKED